MKAKLAWPVAIGIPLLVAALGVIYYFAIFLPRTDSIKNLSENQADCLRMEQSLLKEQAVLDRQSLTPIGDQNAISPVKAHYNVQLGKCFVELDTNYSISGNQTNVGYLGNDFAIFNATEDQLVVDCSLDGKLNAEPVCTDYTISPLATSTDTSITPARFKILENQYLNN